MSRASGKATVPAALAAAVVVLALLAAALVTATFGTAAPATADSVSTTSTIPSIKHALPEPALPVRTASPGYEFVFLGRPGPVETGFDRYFWLSAPGLGVVTACTGSAAGHCTWAEYFQAYTTRPAGTYPTTGPPPPLGSYLTGDNVPVYFDHRSSTAWFVFAPDADVVSGAWEFTQGTATTRFTAVCDLDSRLVLDDWPFSLEHDDVWHNVKVCEGILPDLPEQDGTLTMREPVEDFEVQLVDGSTRVAHAGLVKETRIRFVKKTQKSFLIAGVSTTVTMFTPLPAAPVVVNIDEGPSINQPVMCVGAPRPPTDRNACFTDGKGRVVVSYLVPADAADPFVTRTDRLRVFVDDDRDNMLDLGADGGVPERVAYLYVPIAKAINYVALGDSYSSGENGGEQPDTGEYQTGVSPADDECRRWDQAYPYVFADTVLKFGESDINVTFATFACTGAETVNIHDLSDLNPTPAPPAHAHITDRPSSAAVFGRPVPWRGSTLPRDPRWEPRQTTSLQAAQTELARAMRDVDMITVTIGGNDAGFAGVLEQCVKSGCDASNTNPDYAAIGIRVAAVITELRSVAPKASIFVLGYPYLTPDTRVCVNPQEVFVPDTTSYIPGQGVWVFTDGSDDCLINYARINDCSALSAVEVANRSLVGVGAVFQFVFGLVDRIDFSEAQFLSGQADELNKQIRAATARSGAHFVDVVGDAAGATGFVGHSPCAGSDAWLYGFEPKNGTFGVSLGSAASARSFHPNEAGHQGYSDVLQRFIRNAVSAADTVLNEAGLPVNPAPQSGPPGARYTAASSPANPESQPSDTATTRDADASDTPPPSADFLVAQRIVEGTDCDAPFVSPGEQLRLVAAGFAAGSEVTFTVQAWSFGGTELTAPAIPAATADADGTINVLWTVPAAPAVTVDAAPRLFSLEASGLNTDGGVHTGVPIVPLVAYPSTPPCVTDDTAATTLGQSVNITALGNDTAPTGSSLNVTSMRILATSDEGFVADTTTGVVTYTPPPGFYGTAVGSYVVYDMWGVGARADITVTVASGCTITGTAGVTEITGTDADDVICVPDPDDRQAFHVIYGLGGNDVILGGAGTEWIYGGEGADILFGGGEADRILGGPGVDTVYGGTGFDYVYSLDLEDVVVDDDYEILVTPQGLVPLSSPAAHDDWAWVGVSDVVEIDVLGNDYDPNDNLDEASLTIVRPPGAGTATVISAAAGTAVVEYMAPATASAAIFTYRICDTFGGCADADVLILVGTAGCTITGTDAGETLTGTAGNDVICALGGDDVVYGMGGDDIIIGGSGDDIIYGGDTTLIGVYDGDDHIWGGPGDDTLYGGNGDDALFGEAGDDTLAGNRRDDRLYGGIGDDTIVGGGENDVIYGGAGDDVLNGHAHNDIIYGGPGVDTVRGGDGDDVLWGNQGNDILIGGTGVDVLYGGQGDDSLDGNTQNDLLWGGPGDDTLNGLGHADQLHGGPGDDMLNGGPGDDRMFGAEGDDTLDGGNDIDFLDAGSDIDTCRRGETTVSCETET